MNHRLVSTLCTVSYVLSSQEKRAQASRLGKALIRRFLSHPLTSLDVAGRRHVVAQEPHLTVPELSFIITLNYAK